MSPRHVPASVTELARVGLFATLPGETLTKLADAMHREDVDAGTVLVREGEPGDRFYVLLAGVAGVSPGPTTASSLTMRPARSKALMTSMGSSRSNRRNRWSSPRS